MKKLKIYIIFLFLVCMCACGPKGHLTYEKTEHGWKPKYFTAYWGDSMLINRDNIQRQQDQVNEYLP
jgi:hypothetical protein